MENPKALAVVRNYFQAWTRGDLAVAGRCLAEDLTVEVPINAYHGKADFLDAVRRTAKMASEVELLAEFGTENEAMLLYDMTLPIAALRVAEHFTVEGGHIRRVRQIHDTAPLRGLGAPPTRGT